MPTDGADPSEIRRIRVDEDAWKAYAEVVGNGGRSADLRTYIDWRIDNPSTPLPGRRRGPVKKVRKGTTPTKADRAADGN